MRLRDEAGTTQAATRAASIQVSVVTACLAIGLPGCGSEPNGSAGVGGTSGAAGSAGSGGTSGVGGGGSISLDSLQNWVRHPKNPVFAGNEIASDAHVWREAPGVYRMVYTDGVGDHQAIGMATSSDLVNWKPIADSEHPNGIVLQGAGPSGKDLHLETAFYRKANDGKHQIFYIGYPEESAYHTAIYKAEASKVQGPYVRESDPVISWSAGGLDATAMTSPTIVEHAGKLYMSYIGWEAYPDGPVHIVGMTSTSDGRAWGDKVDLGWDDNFGVEAHMEKGPDGRFYRVGTVGDAQGNDVIALGQSDHPFGPFTQLPTPILTREGPGEDDSITAPNLLFQPETGTAYVHYTAVGTGGWPWVISLATCKYEK